MDRPQPTPQPTPYSAARALATVFVAGTVAGTLDGAAAVIQAALANGTTPAAVFRYVASGVFGASARTGGAAMVCWGVAFHYLIACTWAALFVALAARVPSLTRHPLVIGLAYGVVVWLAMNLVVVPLSHAAPLPRTPTRVLTGAAILMTCIGVPIAWISARLRSVPAGMAGPPSPGPGRRVATLGFVTVLLLAPAWLPAALSAVVAWLADRFDAVKSEPFDVARWRTPPALDAAHPTLRQRMVRDLDRSGRLRGLARQEVLDLLGFSDATGDGEWRWHLGRSPIDPMDDQWLRVRFDGYGRVASWAVR